MKDMEEGKKKIIKISVQGKDLPTWYGNKEKFVQLFDKICNTVINFDDQTTLKDEAKKFISGALKYGYAKIERPVLENSLMTAQIDEIYSQIRINNAVARGKELETKAKELVIQLGTMKAMLTGEPDQESVLFLKKVDAFLEVVRSLEFEK